MELRTLSYFLAVAREQNMTEAANVLHVTQPTLSRQIADLEDELGKKLFTRTSRNTLLTEDGIHLRQRAEEILALVNQTEDELLQLDTGHLKFIPFEPALTLTSVVVWKKYRLLSKSSSVFLDELRKHVVQ